MDSYKTIIEIGSFSIKTIIFSELNKEFSIIGTGKTRSRGYTGEEIENFDDFIDSIKNSIVQAEKQANYIISNFLPGKTPLCTFCGQFDEKISHLFWHCSVVYDFISSAMC